MTDAGDAGVEVFFARWGGVETEGALAERAGGDDLGCEERFCVATCAEVKRLAGVDLAGGFDQGSPKVFGGLGWGVLFDLLGEEDFDLAGGGGGVGLGGEAGAGGEEARGEDAGVVEDEEVAGVEVVGEVGEEVVGEVAGLCGCDGAVEDEHPARSADDGRVLGDEFFREIEVKVGDKHGFLV